MRTSVVSAWSRTKPASTYASAIDAIDAATTVAIFMPALPTQPMDSAAAAPMTGVISGAMSIAPITAAAELAVRPMVAMTIDMVIMNQKLNRHDSVGNSASSSRRRSSGV